MIRNIVAAVALLAFGSIAEPAVPQMVRAQPDSSTAEVGVVDTIHVAPPRGEQMVDRASILAALAQTAPGDVIQFAPGTYVVGEIIPIKTAHLTMLGHGDGTTLRGCHPDAYERMGTEVEAAGGDQWARNTALLTCGMFEMTGGHGTIRGLIFEYTAIGLVLGAGHSDSIDFHLRPGRVTDGGYLVENSVFRNSANGVRPGYLSSGPTVIRGNRFMNLGHALSGSGAEIHMLDNDISVPDPDPLVLPTGPLFAIGVSGAQQAIFEGNRIEGHPVGIALFGSSHRATRHNVIRDNTVHGVSFPLVLWGEKGADGIVIEDNLIERNRISSAAGVGIALNRASSNRILDNTISGIELRHSSLAVPFDLGEGNGSGIWVSPGSDENEIIGNTFEEVGSSAVVLEGNSNRVEVADPADAVRDLGTGNRVSDPNLVGRHPTTQDMTWIAEHHPDRLAGLVYLYHAIAPSPGEDRMLRDRTFAEMMMRYGGCWMGEEAYHRSAPRLLYRPHYIDDAELRIQVPAISFTHPRDFAADTGDVEFPDLTLLHIRTFLEEVALTRSPEHPR